MKVDRKYPCQIKRHNHDRLLGLCLGGHSLDYAENVCAHLGKSLFEPPLLQIPSMTPASIYSFVGIQSRHRAGRHLVRKHKRHKTSQSEKKKIQRQDKIVGSTSEM